jgi:hypothetical protein
MNAQGAAPLGRTRGQRLISGDSASIPEMTGLPLYDAALVLVSLAAATTVADINSIEDKALALAISAMIANNIEPEAQLADLRARVLENRRYLASTLLDQQQKSLPALEGPGAHSCPQCGAPLESETP